MLTDIYYELKPILPWRLRVMLRKMRAERRRKAFAAVWPIDRAAGATPFGWPGWPEGKQFALVLTHDVEGQKGLNRIPQLIKLTQKYGFRASFNLVPKGEYQVSRQLLDLLDRSGFEAGVHGLEHDGKLYQSKEEFAAKAIQIRKVLDNWGACGFRSPLMQHRLGWIHELGCEYDASTFDVDPYEPQPDGMSTIFPFWVSTGDSTGFVELPYSLVQDFSLFKVLGETNVDIWKKKLDWVAEQGGMALINTHPDYMCFNGSLERDEYPLAYYEEFLSYTREKYSGALWHALPREVARYYCEKLPVGSRNTHRKICMIAYSEYELDCRVRHYAEALARRGDMVDVISLAEEPAAEGEIKINGVTVYRVFRRDRNESGPWASALHQLRFMVKVRAAIHKLHRHNCYDVIHIHNAPNFLVFAARYPKFNGAKLILHIHDTVPELFENKLGSPFKALYVWPLRFIEKQSVKFVNHVIVSNYLWREKLIARSVDTGRCSVLPDISDDSSCFLAGDNHAAASAMSSVSRNQDSPQSPGARGLECVEKNGWAQARKEYLDLIDRLSTENFHTCEPKPDLTPVVER
jgi:glycosyltransferase involved in cell wall biosynthesis